MALTSKDRLHTKNLTQGRPRKGLDLAYHLNIVGGVQSSFCRCPNFDAWRFFDAHNIRRIFIANPGRVWPVAIAILTELSRVTLDPGLGGPTVVDPYSRIADAVNSTVPYKNIVFRRTRSRIPWREMRCTHELRLTQDSWYPRGS